MLLISELIKKVYFLNQSATRWQKCNHHRFPMARASASAVDLILQAEAAAGMYKKAIELLAKEIHYEPLPAEARIAAIAAWTRARSDIAYDSSLRLNTAGTKAGQLKALDELAGEIHESLQSFEAHLRHQALRRSR